MTDEAVLTAGERLAKLPMSDEEVVRRVCAGEAALFEIVMRRYNRRLYRVARAIVRDDAEAEDVMQQAYVNAYTHLDQFGERSSFATWLTRIAVHEALARNRRRARVTAVDDISELEGEEMERLFGQGIPTPEQQAMQGEMHRLLESAIDALPEGYRSVFVLREVEGLSTADVAECLDITDETVKTRLHRARAMLREELYSRAGVATASAFSFHLSRCDRVVTAVFTRLALERMPPMD